MLQPFETWYKQQLKAQKKSLRPLKSPFRSRDDFRVLDLVFVFYRTPYLQRNWSRKNTRALYRIERVITAHGKPYSYQLRDCMTQEIVPGYFAGDVSDRKKFALSFLHIMLFLGTDISKLGKLHTR